MSGKPTDEEFEAYLAQRGSYLSRGQKHVLIYDAARLGVLSPEQRQRQIDWLKARMPLVKKLSMGSALVITSPAVRLVLSIVSHLTQVTSPYHTVRSLEEAAAWAAGRLADEGYYAEAHRVRLHFGLLLARAHS